MSDIPYFREQRLQKLQKLLESSAHLDNCSMKHDWDAFVSKAIILLGGIELCGLHITECEITHKHKQ